jgi:hypothetical protein
MKNPTEYDGVRQQSAPPLGWLKGFLGSGFSRFSDCRRRVPSQARLWACWGEEALACD